MSCCFQQICSMKMADASWEISDTSQQHRQEWHQRKIFRQIYKFLRLDLQNKWLLYIITNRGRKKDIVLEMHYTDLNQTYQIWLLEHGSKVEEDSNQFYRIQHVWKHR